MLEAIVSVGPKAKLVNSPVPTPGPDQVLIRTATAAANPKDWSVSEPHVEVGVLTLVQESASMVR